MGQTEGSQRILSRLADWANARDDVRAIAVVGSHARVDHPADRWSDLDLVLLARRPRRYLGDTRWIDAIETPWLAVLQPTLVGDEQILHITFEGGAKVDLVVVSSGAFSWAARAIAWLRRHPSWVGRLPRIARERLTILSRLLNRGFRFVVDKDGIGARLGSGGLPLPPPTPPSEEEYRSLVKSFLNEQVSMALKLGRGELFVVKTLGEPRLMKLLVQMLEWHTQVTSDRWSPVFEEGRFLEEWAPPSVVERLRGLFPGYDAAEIRRARLEALDLFRELARETGAHLGYSYPLDMEETVMGWVRDATGETAEGRP